MRTFRDKLTDQGTTTRCKRRTVPVVVKLSPAYLELCPEGYGEKSSKDSQGSPVILEVHEGKLRLIVFADINSEEPTHVIDLEGASESARKAG